MSIQILLKLNIQEHVKDEYINFNISITISGFVNLFIYISIKHTQFIYYYNNIFLCTAAIDFPSSIAFFNHQQGSVYLTV